jgi:hypothetical protein
MLAICTFMCFQIKVKSISLLHFMIEIVSDCDLLLNQVIDQNINQNVCKMLLHFTIEYFINL